MRVWKCGCKRASVETLLGSLPGRGPAEAERARACVPPTSPPTGQILSEPAAAPPPAPPHPPPARWDSRPPELDPPNPREREAVLARRPPPRRPSHQLSLEKARRNQTPGAKEDRILPGDTRSESEAEEDAELGTRPELAVPRV